MDPFTGSLILGGVGAIGNAFGADSSAKAQRSAAAAQEREADRELNWMRDQYYDQRQLNQPWLAAGTDAVGRLQNMRAPDFSNIDPSRLPGYEWQRKQGEDASMRRAAASGMALSGAQLKGLSEYNTGYATTKYGEALDRARMLYNDEWNRLSGLAGTGQTAVQQIGSMYGPSAAMQQNVGAMNTGAAANRAGAAMAPANALNSTIRDWTALYTRTQAPQYPQTDPMNYWRSDGPAAQNARDLGAGYNTW